MNKILLAASLVLLTTPAMAQCFNRSGCDPSTYEIRSQLSVSIPLGDQTAPSDALKAIDDAQHQLSALSARELDVVKAIYGSEASLRSANTSSNMQENNFRGATAFVSINNTYAVKKPK